MINIVFLLLVFVLLAATLAPPDPLPVAPPVAAEGAPGEAGGAVLFVAADGALAFGTLRGEAALAAAAAAEGLMLRADAGLDGTAFAAILARLAEAGAGSADLVVVRR